MAGQNQPIEILRGTPPPAGRYAISGDCHALRVAIAALKPDESFVWRKCFQTAYLAARQIGARIRTMKVDGGRRVWRIEERGHSARLPGAKTEAGPPHCADPARSADLSGQNGRAPGQKRRVE